MRSALVLALLLAAAPETAKWVDSPEAYFLTREERREWDALRSEAEQARFIDAFRARRPRNRKKLDDVLDAAARRSIVTR